MSAGDEASVTWEDELLAELAPLIEVGTVIVRPNDEEVFGGLQQRFPVGGSQIDWARVPGAVRGRVPGREETLAASLAFVDDMVATYELTGSCVIVSDNGFDVALQLPVSALKGALGPVLSIPQHHYVVADDCGWCICFSMEGYMDFGRQPQ